MSCLSYPLIQESLLQNGKVGLRIKNPEWSWRKRIPRGQAQYNGSSMHLQLATGIRSLSNHIIYIIHLIYLIVDCNRPDFLWTAPGRLHSVVLRTDNSEHCMLCHQVGTWYSSKYRGRAALISTGVQIIDAVFIYKKIWNVLNLQTNKKASMFSDLASVLLGFLK